MSTTAKRISKPLATLFVLVLLLIASAIPAHAADLSGAKKALANGLKNNQTVIDLSTPHCVPWCKRRDPGSRSR